MYNNSAYVQRVKTGFCLDPRTKIILMITISTLAFFDHQNLLFISTLAIIPSILLLTNKQYKVVMIYGGLFLFAFILRILQTKIELPFIFYTVGGMLIWLVLRLFPAFLLGYYLIESTKSSEFVAAMQKWNIPDSFIIPVSVVFRFVPTIKVESQNISDAMKMRNIRFGSKIFWKNPGMLLEYRIVPLIISVVKIGEELSAAALTKGLGKYSSRNSVVNLKFTIYDFFVLLICVLLCVWVVFI